MQTISIIAEKPDITFDEAKDIAWSQASLFNPEASLMAWFDRKKNRHSPSQVECDAEGLPGWEEYGSHHGGQRKIIVGDGDYVFIYT